MIRAGAALAVGAAASAVSPASAAPAARTSRATSDPERLTALTGITVIDARGSNPSETVLVRGDRILARGRRIPVPANAEVIDLAGRFLLPGFVDAHVHSIVDERISPLLHVASGVLTVREMSGSPTLRDWRGRIERGDLLGPRSVVGSAVVDGVPSIGSPPSFHLVADAEQARAAVRQAQVDGADFVKVYSRLSPELYRAIVDEARRVGIEFAGHCPDEVPFEDAARSGQSSIEHLYSAWYSVSAREAELREQLADLTFAPGDYLTWAREIHRLEWAAIDSRDPAKEAALLADLAETGVHVVPTLGTYEVLDRPEEVDRVDARLRYVPQPLADGWRWGLENLLIGSRTPEEAAQRRLLLEERRAFVEALARAGVPVIAGTDGGDVPFVVPGFGLHDELAALVRAGLTPQQAIEAATATPARMLGLDHEIGTVAPGKVADLVVLDADPLADIANTTRIVSVVHRGRVIDSAERVRILEQVAAAAATG